jgi:hypothetical protein
MANAVERRFSRTAGLFIIPLLLSFLPLFLAADFLEDVTVNGVDSGLIVGGCVGSPRQ